MRSALTPLPGTDRRAVKHLPPPGALKASSEHHVTVVGGGIAGLAAATILAERGVEVRVVEATHQLGGRVAAWPVGEGRTMSRGFHAFFRQYYNLRAILRRTDPTLSRLIPVVDYPLQRPDGMTDSFTKIPPAPPWSFLSFVLRSPSFKVRDVFKVDIPSATELLTLRYPESLSSYDGESAAEFLDRLQFPEDARDLALEVFARSFFADPSDFAAGELVSMFHTYFMGSAEGLIFDVPDDDYDTALWSPLATYLESLGATIHCDTRVHHIELGDDGCTIWDSEGEYHTDAVVLATDPRMARRLISSTTLPTEYLERVERTRNAPPFAVLRVWLDQPVSPERTAFLATSGYGPLDNISVLNRFEEGAREWAEEHDGAVVELHAYAAPDRSSTDSSVADELRRELLEQMYIIFPETAAANITHEEYLVEDDCTLVDPGPWGDRPGVATPDTRLVVAGDWVRCDYPIALMERAATTGILAANQLLAHWGVAGEELWTVPMEGILGRFQRKQAPAAAR